MSKAKRPTLSENDPSPTSLSSTDSSFFEVDLPSPGSNPGPADPVTMTSITVPPIVPPAVVVKPTMPTMGDLSEITPTEWSAWTGGKPNYDWSGLEDANAAFTSPNQLRPQYPTSAQKSFNYRKTGLTVKFVETDDLTFLQDAVLMHLEDTGMDTIAYQPDPVDSRKMLNVTTDHARFTIESARANAARITPHYDSYDKLNDNAAKQYLLDSLNKEFCIDLKKRCLDTDTFAVVWILLVKKIHMTSIGQFEAIKTRIKSRDPNNYSGQDILKLGTAFRDDAKLLVQAGQYDHNLTLVMIDAFLKAGGDSGDGDFFRFKLFQFKSDLGKELLAIAFMSKTDADAHMITKQLTYSSVCEAAEREYGTLLAESKWTPAKNARDSKAPPKLFGANTVERAADSKLTFPEFMTLFQAQGGFATKKGNCNICKKPGHWARECPDNTNKSGNRPSGTTPRNGRPNSNRNGTRPQSDGSGPPKGWRFKPPAPGDPAKKTIPGSAKPFEWCATCKRWSTTHNTTSHTGQSTRSAPQANICLVPDPSAWYADFEYSEPDAAPTPEEHDDSDAWRPTMTLLLLSLGLLRFQDVLTFGLSVDWVALLLSIPDILSANAHFLWEHGLVGFTIVWVILLFLSLWTNTFRGLSRLAKWLNLDPGSNGFSRRQRRAHAQAHVRANRPRSKHASIWDYGFHRSYPRRLRTATQFVGDAPTVSNQLLARQISTLHASVMRLEKRVNQLCRPSKCTARKGGNKGTVRVQTHLPANPQPRAQNRPRAPHYRPVPSTNPKQNGNNRVPQRRTQAVRKIATQVQMMCVEAANPQNPALLRMALQSPIRFQNAIPKESQHPVIWDSGASISISSDRKDFVGQYQKVPASVKLQGLAKGLHIAGQGHVMWAFHDADGQLRAIKVPAYHAPACRVRLLSTTSLLQTYPGETITIEADRLTLSGLSGDPTRGSVTARVDPSNNLPTTHAYHHGAPMIGAQALSATISVVNDENSNLSEPEKELLRWHFRLGHLAFRRIQFLMRTGVLSHSHATRRLHTAAAKIETPPKCAACQFGKQTRRPSPGKTSTAVKDREGALKKDHLVAGQQVSVDHFVCSTKGRLFDSRGKTADKDLYCGGCLFSDNATGYVHVEFQSHLNSHETLKAKEEFELMCRDLGVVPQSYHSDNGSAFTSSDYSQHLREFAQVSSFAGAGAHHHNGTAERAIQTIMNVSRTMMLHAAIHWPDVADATLWPMAVQHAVFLYNHVPDPDTGIAPADLFTRTRWEQRKLHDLHVWGCPVYVLDKTLSDGKKIPRWKPRSKRTVNMGLSRHHASTVPLVLNPDTGSITAQFHVVFDDWFATVANDGALPDFNSDEWARLFGESTYQYPFDEDDLAQIASDVEHPGVTFQRDAVATAMDTNSPVRPLPVAPPPIQTPKPQTPVAAMQHDQTSAWREHSPALLLPSTSPLPREPTSARREPSRFMTPLSQQKSARRESVPATNRRLSISPEAGVPPAPVPAAIPETVPAPPPRRSTRTTRPPVRLLEANHLSVAGTAYLSQILASPFAPSAIPYPVSYKATVSDPDLFTYEEAMSDPVNREQWLAAMVKEINSLEEHGTWDEVSITDAKTKVIPGTWVLRIKRGPDGDARKWKARYCVRGDLEPGEQDTFAPVVAWSSVRLFLILSMTLGWTTCSIDFSNAFVQAELSEPVWIHLPRGFQSSLPGKTCLRLKRSQYGLSVAPRLWHEHLNVALFDLGFKPSANDPCLLCRPNMMLAKYVDDVAIASPDPAAIDKFIEELKEKGFELTREGTFSEFLGIKLTEDKQTGTITLTQKGLIEKIIKATGMEDCNPNWTPASTQALGIDPDGPPMDEDWNYRSIIGMLLYLSTNTRPDITFAVSQVARFSHSPKQSHAQAVKMIVRYLSRTVDMGTIVTPTGDLSIDCWVDADFAGLYKRDPDHVPSSVKSRTGYSISVGGCLLIWKSQLQTEISLSTLESEYSALSNSLRSVLHIRSLLLDVSSTIGLSETIRATIHARVFEDNAGALLLATNHRITSRTKYFLCKWHHFWSHVNSGAIEILKVDTTKNRSDWMTKGLVREVFERIRKLNLGW